jgi:hypothetical protein
MSLQTGSMTHSLNFDLSRAIFPSNRSIVTNSEQKRKVVREEWRLAVMVAVFHFRFAPVLQGVAFPYRSLLQDR